METINVLVFGCNGRMGQLLCKAIAQTENFVVIGGYDVEYKEGLHDFPIYTSMDKLEQLETLSNDTDLFIDFSDPELTMQVLKLGTKHGIPILIGTKGFSNNQKREIRNAAKHTAIFHSSNMSYAVKNIENISQNANLSVVGTLAAARYLLDCGCKGYFSMNDLFEDACDD